MLKLTHKRSGVVLFGWQVPGHDRMPSCDMIEWLETSETEWSGDEFGIEVHSAACRTAVPGDFVVMKEGELSLRVIHGYELPLFWVEAHVATAIQSVGEQTVNGTASAHP